MHPLVRLLRLILLTAGFSVVALPANSAGNWPSEPPQAPMPLVQAPGTAMPGAHVPPASWPQADRRIAEGDGSLPASRPGPTFMHGPAGSQPVRDMGVVPASFYGAQPANPGRAAAEASTGAGPVTQPAAFPPTVPATQSPAPFGRLRALTGLPLPPPSRATGTDANRPHGLSTPAVTVAGSLAVVLGLFCLLVWALRRARPAGTAPLPSEVLEVLGRAPLAHRQHVYLLRCGQKLLLVSVTPGGVETLSEIAEPLEVDRLAGLCRQAHPHSATAAFRQIFKQFERDPSGEDFFGAANPDHDDLPDRGAPDRRDLWENAHV